MIVSISIEAASALSSHPSCILMLVRRQTAGMETERILLDGSPICIMHEHENTGCCLNHQTDMKEEVVAPTINLLGEGSGGWVLIEYT